MSALVDWDEVFATPEAVLEPLVQTRPARVVVEGPMGAGKSTLAALAADALAGEGERVWCISADPGTPAFGIPGAVALAERGAGAWRLTAQEPLCSFDAARFRLPLVEAVRRLLARVRDGCLLVDAPGVMRGVAGAELLTALAEAAEPALMIWLQSAGASPPLSQEIHGLPLRRWRVEAAQSAARPAAMQRARQRTRAWDAYLAGAPERAIELAGVAVLGTPPPLDQGEAWLGRQVAIRGDDGAAGFGEITQFQGDRLTLVTPFHARGVDRLIVRDARRGADGLLTTAAPVRPPASPAPQESDPSPAGVPGAEVGAASVSLVNGVFGDPVLHLRLRHRRRSLLFDVGDVSRLPTRVLHQVTDLFITHAHADHIGGFMGLLRARIGYGGPCRVYGPPGIAWNIEGFVRGIHWDRIGDEGPAFEVTEVHPQRVHRYHVQAGRSGPTAAGEAPLGEGVLLREPDFSVRCAMLDHGTPVLAYAFEPRAQANVRKERLQASALQPGPWLTDLKRAWLAGEDDALIPLPDGTERTVAALAEAFLVAGEPRRVVYATDLADSADNRARLTALARGAHTLVCEAAFLPENAEQARYTGHLTAGACGEIAAAANVRQLLPFHFSPRYEGEVERVYAAVAAACPQVNIRR